MKIIVVSDIHGRYERLIELMDMHKDADALIFLGDGLADLTRADAYSYPFTVFAVRGNCDVQLFPWRDDVPVEMTLNFEGFKFLILHGHSRSVKSGLDDALLASKAKGANVLLYGHTHVPQEKYLPEGTKINNWISIGPLHILNPGSLGDSSDGKAHFGLIEIRNGQILTSLGVL